MSAPTTAVLEFVNLIFREPVCWISLNLQHWCSSGLIIWKGSSPKWLVICRVGC